MLTEEKFVVVVIGTLATINDFRDGAPSGVIYTGLQMRFPEVSLNLYLELIDSFCRDGLVTRANDLLYPTAKLGEMMRRANAILVVKG